jgi:hypothetical protein
LVTQEGVVASTDLDKAEILGSFFSSVFVHEDVTNIPNMEGSPVDSFLSQIDFTREKILKKLNNLKINKSAGPDSVYPRILKELSHEITEPLQSIFTTSFRTGKLPDIWKIGNICAIHKKGPRQECNNYRPVSLTSIVSKIMESIIRDELMAYMTTYNLFSDKQYGFLPKRSTVQQLLKIIDKWTEILDEGKVLEGVYMDFQKAFDTVPHGRLLQKLQYYGITGNLQNWIKEFLNGRTQQVVINDKTSSPLPVLSGVPQGSVLGPVLFLIYVNDLPSDIISEIYLFADDAKLFMPLEDDRDHQSRIQYDLIKLQEWSNKWLLRFHPDKCKRLYIHKRQQDSRRQDLFLQKCDPDGNLMQVKLETVHQHKDLGLIVDDRLPFESHISTITSKANQIMGLISRTFKYLEKEVFIPLYKALVRSRLEYGQ